jgi:two-component system, OmpR family, phosphate regulon sensor histidine kinase PhoR
MTQSTQEPKVPLQQDAAALYDLLAQQARQLQAMRTALEAEEKTLEALRAQIEIQARTHVTHDVSPASIALSLATALADAAYDGLIVVDDKQRILAINQSAVALFGRVKLLGEKVADVTTIEELEMMVDDALRYLEDPIEEQIVYQSRMYRVKVKVVEPESHRFICIALQDVTELVRLNRARRDMVANISHELRTPIANIRLSIEGLFHEQDKPKRKASISALKSIARETDSLLWLVQELYDLSMIESGQAILRAVNVPLGEVVGEAIERMLEIGEGKELRIIQTGLDAIHVLADRDQIRRVLTNLIHNAIKFSPVGGVILVTATIAGEDVVISVVDEGPGIAPDHVQRIFERFFQADSARSGGDGTGLGLAICKHIVEAHDGRIWAESNVERPGGRFYFTLPLADASDSP